MFSKFESVFRKVSGIFIILISFLGAMWAFGFIPLALIYGIYLLKAKKYHLITDSLFFVIGLLIYFVPVIPLIGPGPASHFKVFISASDWSDRLAFILPLSLLSKMLFTSLAVSIFLTGIFSRFKKFSLSPQKERVVKGIYLLSLLVFLFEPLFIPFGVSKEGGGPSGWGSTGCPPQDNAFNIQGENVGFRFDQENKLWIYQIIAKNSLAKDAKIISISALKPRLNTFEFFKSLIPEKKLIAPPFGTDIEISRGEKTQTGLKVRPGEQVTIKIISQEPLFALTLLDSGNCKSNFNFLSPGGGQEESLDLTYTEALDENTKIVLTNTLPPTEDAGKTVFKVGEIIYPNEEGLPKGTVFGFRLLDSKGKMAVLFGKADISKARKGVGMECNTAFNQKGRLLSPGLYTMELIKVEDKNGFIVARVNLQIVE